MVTALSFSVTTTTFASLMKKIYHWTWYSPDSRTRKAPDHILISWYWKSSVTNCCVYRGAELGNTDHHLLVAQLKLKLQAQRHTTNWLRLDSSLLSDLNIATNFSCSICCTFDSSAADKLTDWQTFKESVIQSARNVLGCSTSSPNKPWISERTLNIIKHRREARLWGDLTDYQQLNRQCNVQQTNNMSHDFSLLRQACNGPHMKTAQVKDCDGNVITTEVGSYTLDS